MQGKNGIQGIQGMSQQKSQTQIQLKNLTKTQTQSKDTLDNEINFPFQIQNNRLEEINFSDNHPLNLMFFHENFLKSLNRLAILDLTSTILDTKDHPFIFTQLTKYFNYNSGLQRLCLVGNNINYSKEISNAILKFLNIKTLSDLSLSNNNLGFKMLEDLFEVSVNKGKTISIKKRFLSNAKIEYNKNIDLGYQDKKKIEKLSNDILKRYKDIAKLNYYDENKIKMNIMKSIYKMYANEARNKKLSAERIIKNFFTAAADGKVKDDF